MKSNQQENAEKRKDLRSKQKKSPEMGTLLLNGPHR